jgi:hypothetical protein
MHIVWWRVESWTIGRIARIHAHFRYSRVCVAWKVRGGRRIVIPFFIFDSKMADASDFRLLEMRIGWKVRGARRIVVLLFIFESKMTDVSHFRLELRRSNWVL